MRALPIAFVCLVTASVGAAGAPLKVAALDIEPFELAQTQELQDMLVRENAVLRRTLAEQGLVVVDTAPQASEIVAHQPLGQCGGCAAAIAHTLGADLVVSTTVQEIEYPVYNVFASVRDAASNRELRKAVVSVEGLAGEDWDRGIATLVKERLLATPLPVDAERLRAMVERVPVAPE